VQIEERRIGDRALANGLAIVDSIDHRPSSTQSTIGGAIATPQSKMNNRQSAVGSLQ
jgi:hypothetical protein